MPVAKLTPVERGALFVLMANGRPLRESADLKAVYGLALKPSHRTKLQRLGLIETTKKPWTHALSQKGWQWTEEQLSAARPKGQMGMGPLYALLHGLRRHIERHRCTLRDVFSEAGKTTDIAAQDRIENAAWAEADEALAQALQDMSVFNRALNKLHGRPKIIRRNSLNGPLRPPIWFFNQSGRLPANASFHSPLRKAEKLRLIR